MKSISLALAALLLSTPCASADLLLTSKSHTDAYELFGKQVPVKDSTSTLWLAKDRLRLESENMHAIVRLDQKRLILLDPEEKAWRAITLPFEFKNYLPPEKLFMAEQMFAARALQAKLEAKDETKKFGAWDAKCWEITLSQRGFVYSKEVLWVTSGIQADSKVYGEMQAALASITPEQRNLVKELGRIEGLPVRRERTQNLSGVEVRTVEELVTAQEKEAPAGIYDPPADYTERPYELLRKAPPVPLPGTGGK
ncbi:MAG: DUF4412 domain-containing protein [Planctomycetes bacterium]|nr:DUF4412 domain-containing protein [Planctomycetota bacterium]